MEGPLFVLGAVVGMLIMTMISVAVIVPTTKDVQFQIDCKTMAHGKVNNHLCVKGDKILFHE